MINYSLTPEQISEEIISYYESNAQYFDGYKFHKPFEITCVRLAIDKVTDLLSVCPETLNSGCINNGYNCRKRNPAYTALKSVLEILNSKIK